MVNPNGDNLLYDVDPNSPKLGTPKGHILFLDEIKMARCETLNILFQLIHDGGMVGMSYTMPDNCFIVSACNDPEHNPEVFEFSKPLNDRFVHIYVQPSIAEFQKWGAGLNKQGRQRIHPYVLKYLESNKAYFSAECIELSQAARSAWNDSDIVVPTPRSWSKVSEIEYSLENLNTADRTLASLVTDGKIFQGILGKEVSIKYSSVSLQWRKKETFSVDFKKAVFSPFNSVGMRNTMKSLEGNTADKAKNMTLVKEVLS